jgi:uncharacterized protein YuzE
MQFSHDPEADAVYITLRDVPYKWGHDLDAERRVDFGDDNKPMGIELLDVSGGVDIRDLPEQEFIAELLRQHGIKVLTPAPR